LITTSGPVPNPHRHPAHTINTSRILEEDLIVEDEEPELLSVMPATGWQAVVKGEGLALVAWVAMDNGRMYGVAIGENGCIDLTNDVEKHPAFSGYEQTNELQKEQ
jgi:hypothetical protein